MCFTVSWFFADEELSWFIMFIYLLQSYFYQGRSLQTPVCPGPTITIALAWAQDPISAPAQDHEPLMWWHCSRALPTSTLPWPAWSQTHRARPTPEHMAAQAQPQEGAQWVLWGWGGWTDPDPHPAALLGSPAAPVLGWGTYRHTQTRGSCQHFQSHLSRWKGDIELMDTHTAVHYQFSRFSHHGLCCSVAFFP